MAVSGISSSSSIYGTRNVISGLASGIDTESMIENAVSGYNTKITTLGQERTKLEWQQAAYRSIIEKMAAFTSKYTSYTSSTNLMSLSFFNSAVSVSSKGEFADLVSASGKTSSDVQILGVKQLAKAATYTVSGIGTAGGETPTIKGTEALDLSEKMDLSNISGSLTINYGSARSYTIDFDELEVYKDAGELAAAISKKLGEQTMTLSDGTNVAANTRIGVRTNNGSIEFYDKASNNSVYVGGVSGKIKDTLGIKADKETTSIDVGDKALYNTDRTKADYIATKEISFTLDGVTKRIQVSGLGENPSTEDLAAALNKELEEAFGSGKVSASAEDGVLSFSTQKGSTMSVSGGEVLGLSKYASTYANTSMTLGELLGEDTDWTKFSRTEAEGAVEKRGTNYDDMYYVDSKGHRVKQDGDTWYRVDDEGEFLYDFKINDEVVGSFNKNTALESVMTSINNNADLGISVSYSKTTNQFQFKAKESGEASRVEMGEGLAQALFGGGTSTKGQDAVFSMTVNGVKLEDISRSSNTFDVDGLTINLKGTFNYEDTRVKDDNGLYLSDGTNTINGYESKWLDEQGRVVDENGNLLGGGSVYGAFLHQDAEGNKITDTSAQKTGSLISGSEAVTFESKADTDKIVEAIRSMVNDYNAMVTEIKNAYSTLPLTNSSGNSYEPLTDEDRADMSESSIEAYEDKAKTGLLFGDRDLSSLYSRLRDAIQMTGQDGADLSAIGITTSYSSGLTTLSLDENKLRAALESDPDKVAEVFTKSKDNGSSTNGLMQALKVPLDMYAKTTGTKGILVEKAGSPLAPTSIYNNTLQQQLDDLDEEIEKWEEKLSDQIDYYTSKFSQLEQLILEMNAQSSSLSSLMSGY